MHNYIWYCKSCNSVKFDTTDASCNPCTAKMEDISHIKTIEDAMWWGMKHPKTSIAPSIDWELHHGYVGKRDITPSTGSDW